MKVYQPKEKFTSVKTHILQLQLSLELSQIQKIQSTYSELFLCFAKYSFLFESSITDLQPLKSTHAPVESTLSTQDPIMDGGNWWNYCRNNPLTYVDPSGLTTLDDFYYQKRTEDTDKSIENQQKYNMKEYEVTRGNQGLTESGNMNYIYNKYCCHVYDDKNYLRRIDDNLSGVPFQYQEILKEQKINEAYDFLFSCIMQSLVGVPYVLGGDSRKGTDCSGSIILALEELGICVDDVTANEMSLGYVDWISILPLTKEAWAGNMGLLNFYDTGGKGNITHVNVGIGEIGIPKLFKSNYLRKKQIIDATEGSTMLCRNNGRLYLGQYNQVGEKQINQTYAPFSTNTHPIIQGIINWTILRNELRR